MRNAAFLALLLSYFVPGELRAQAFDPTTEHPSIMILNGLWKFHTGDPPGPVYSEAPLWAEPNFDDSAWQDYAIDPRHHVQTVAEAI